MGYLGMVGGPDPCANQIESIRAARPIAFRASPYGVSHDLFPPSATIRFVPYLIDPVTLVIEWREDLITAPFSEALTLAAALDDVTMVWHEVGPPTGGSYTSRFRVLTRSGITISMSGEQESVATNLPEASVGRLDSSHFFRRYTVPTTLDIVVQVFSVSGSTISLDASTTYANGLKTVSRDGGEAGTATLLISPTIDPFRWDGSGTLYAFGSAAGGLPRIHAIPFSLGGSIAAPDASWRSRDAQNTGASPVGKAGSSECLLSATDGVMGFYDDGSQMHYLPVTSSTHLLATPFADFDHETTFGDYLTAHIYEDPPGTPVFGDPAALIAQSGTGLSWSPIGVIVRCYATGSEIAGTFGPTRHDTALGAVSLDLGSGTYRLTAFRW